MHSPGGGRYAREERLDARGLASLGLLALRAAPDGTREVDLPLHLRAHVIRQTGEYRTVDVGGVDLPRPRGPARGRRRRVGAVVARSFARGGIADADLARRRVRPFSRQRHVFLAAVQLQVQGPERRAPTGGAADERAA